MTKLPPGWERATLRELRVQARPGFPSGKHNREGVGVAHLRPMNITRQGRIDMADVMYVSDSSDRRVCGGDVLFNNTNSPALTGKTALVTSAMPLAYSNHMTRLRAPEGINPGFLAAQLHWLWMSGYFARVLNNHVNQASVASGKLLDTPVAVPPEAEQLRIVTALEGYLLRLDTGVSSVRGAATRSRGLMQLTADTALGSFHDRPGIPLGELLREPLRNGHSARATDGRPGIRTLTLSAVTTGQFTDEHTKITTAEPARAMGLWLKPGDILIERSNTPELVGTAALYTGREDWAIFPDLLVRVRVTESVLSEYVCLVLSTSGVRQYYRDAAKGLSGTMPKINQTIIERTMIPQLSPDEQRRLVTSVSRAQAGIARLTAAASSSARRAEQLRSTLYAEAFSGRLALQDPADEPASLLLERLRQSAQQHARKRNGGGSREG